MIVPLKTNHIPFGIQRYCHPVWILLLIVIAFLQSARAEEWELVKDKNDIKIYTRNTEGSKYKTYKGVAILNMDIREIYETLIDVENYDRWVYECTESRLLSKKEHQEYIYYSVIHMPWPFDDRDMITRMAVSDKNDTIRLATKLDPGYMEPVDGMVRISAYDEVTTLIRMGEGSVKMVMEGYFEPGGSLPAWLYNMFLSEGPYESIMSLKELYGNK